MWFTKGRRAASSTDYENWREAEVSPTLNLFDNRSETRATMLRIEADGVRRLTPEETEALQGFDRGWTAGRPEGVRYAQTGNAVAVPVAEWIIRRLVDVNGA